MYSLEVKCCMRVNKNEVSAVLFLCVLVDLNQAVQLDAYQVLWGDVGIPHLSIRVNASPLLTSFLKK